MKDRFSDANLGRLAVIVLGIALLWLRFPDFFVTPNLVIEPYADGLKAYTNIEYHARHDSSFTYFEGMNYPYGDHASAAVTQPLVSGLIKVVSDYVVDITGYTRAIVNFSLLLGILLGAYFLYLSFLRLGTVPWWGAAASLGIVFLSPQIYRFIAHYGLSHIEVLPILFYLLIRLEEAHSLKYSLWMAVALLVFPLIHFYYFVIMAMTISFYFFFGFLRKPTVRRFFRYLLHFSVQIGPPLVFFYLWMYHNNPVTDRAARPWGFFHFHSIWEDIVTSTAMPYFAWINEEVIAIQDGGFEGKGYIGLVALIGLLVLTIRWVSSGFKAPFVQAGGELQPFLNKMMLTSLVLLLLSFGLPFTIPGLEGLLDYTGPYQQFRSVGRFNWPFYYAINLIVFTELWAWIDQSKAQWKLGLGIGALLLLGFEAYHSCTDPDLKLDDIRQLHEGETFADLPGIDYREFQATVPLPYFNLGSDNFWMETSGNVMPWTLMLGMQTGLPTTGAALTRTSRSQSYNQLQLVSEPYRVPKILEDFPNEKPLLLVLGKYQFEQQKARFEHMLTGAQLLFENDQYALYRLPLTAFEERIEAKVRDINYTLKADSAALYPVAGFLSRDSTHNFFYESFDTLATERYYRGGGAYTGEVSQPNVLFDGTLPRQYGTGWYTFSTWIYVDVDRLATGFFHIEEYDAQSGEHLQEQHYRIYDHFRTFDSNGWALVEMGFIPQRSNSRIRFWVDNQDIGEAPLFVDELLIRHDIAEIYQKGQHYLFKNNRWYPVE